MTDKQGPKRSDSQSGHHNTQKEDDGPARQQAQRKYEGNEDSTFAQGGEGSQKQGNERQSGKR